MISVFLLHTCGRQRFIEAWRVCVCVNAVHVEDIIFHMFQYIQKLRTEGPQAWVFEECKVINVVYSATSQTEGQDELDPLILLSWETNGATRADGFKPVSCILRLM